MTYGQKPRPLGITALAIPDAAGAAVPVLLGFSLLSGMQAYIQMLVNIDFSCASIGTDFLALAVQLFSAFFIVIGLLALLSAYGLWNGKSWARWMSIILSLLGALTSVFILPAGAVSLAIELLILYYLTRGQVRDYFKPVAESLPAVSA